MFDITIEIEGLEEFKSRWETSRVELVKDLQDATLTAAEEGAKVARAVAPVREGDLHASIDALPVRATANGGESEFSATAPHAAAVAYGTRPHVITTRRAKALRFSVGGRIVFRRSVNHPGTEPHQYMDDGRVAAGDKLFDEAVVATQRFAARLKR